MPGNEVGDRVHNFFAQENLSHDFNFMQATSRAELTKNQSKSQHQNMNNYMYGRHVLQPRLNEAVFLGLDRDSTQDNVNQRELMVHELQQGGVSEHISNSNRSNDIDAHGSLNLFGGQHQMNIQHPGLLQQEQQQLSGFSDMHLQQQLMLRQMQELQGQKDMQELNSRQHSSGFSDMHLQRQLMLRQMQELQGQKDMQQLSTRQHGSGFSDMHLQRQLMLRQMQELRRQKDMQQVNTRQHGSVNQASPIARQTSGNSSHGLINATLSSESFRAELSTGNTNQHAPPAMHGSSSGLIFSSEQDQAQRSVGFVQQHVDQSLYGVPVSGSRGPLNSYLYGSKDEASTQQMATYGNRYAGIPEQVINHDGTLVSEQDIGHIFGQGSNSWIKMEQIQQLTSTHQTGSNQEYQGPSDLIGHSQMAQDEPAIEASHVATSLDPDEEKILFGSDENIWDAFGIDRNMGGEPSNLLDENNNGFASGLPSIQSGRWSALMQSAVAEASETGIGFENLEHSSARHLSVYEDSGKQQRPSADVNLLNAPAMSFGVGGAKMQQYQSNNHTRVVQEEIGQGDGIWRVNALPNSIVDPESTNTSMGSPQISGGGSHFGQFPMNSHQISYWKHVGSSMRSKETRNLRKPPGQLNKGSHVSESSFTSSDKEDLKINEIESRSKRENSNDSYQSSSSCQVTTSRLRENSSSDAGRMAFGQRKFQYHPMGNLDEVVEMPYGKIQSTNTQASSLQHFQRLRGQDQGNVGHTNISSQVPKISAEMGKGNVLDLEGIAKRSHGIRSKDMIGGHDIFDRSAGLSMSEKDSQSSQNMLELFQKVDQSRYNHGTARSLNSSEHNLSSEMQIPDCSDGSLGSLQRSQSSNSQGFGLQLGPPSLRSPLPDNTSKLLHQAELSSNLRNRGQALLPSFQETPHGGFNNNRINSSEQNTTETSVHKMTANLSSSLGAVFPVSRGQLQNHQMVNESLNRLTDKASFGQYNDAALSHKRVKTPQTSRRKKSLGTLPQTSSSMSENRRSSKKLLSESTDLSSQQQDFTTSVAIQNLEDQKAENRGNLIPNSEIDLEAFGRSLKPNNFNQNYSLMNQMKAMKNMDNDSCNRVTKRLKVSDNVIDSQQVGDISTCSSTVPPGDSGDNVEKNVPSQPGYVPSNNMTSIKAEYSHISPQMAPSWFDRYGTFKNGQMSERVGTVKSIEPTFSVEKLSGGLETHHNTKGQASSAADISQVGGNQHVVTLRAKKRRLTPTGLHPWFLEVSASFKNLQGICTGAVEWSGATNRLMEKVDDDGNVIEDVLQVTRSKRRLIVTTLLMQQLFRPPPKAILSIDANSNYENVVYYAARLAAGDACNLVSFGRSFSSVSVSEAKCLSDQSKESERIDDHRLSKVIEGFMSKARKLEDDFSRFDKMASIVDLKLQFEDLERFSIINHFARFHGRVQTDGAETSSIISPRRYVTAVALPAILPDRVQCLSL